MTKDEALRLALVEINRLFDTEKITGATIETIQAIKSALANEALERKAENARELGLDYEPLEAKDEPVAWVNIDDLYDLEAGEDGDVPYVVRGNEQPKNMPKSIPLYTTPPPRKPLTDEEIASIYMNHTDRPMHAQWDFARAIEAAHGIIDPTDLKGKHDA
jgi:hypothetical protein